jgi:PAS domain S-box-containing protein
LDAQTIPSTDVTFRRAVDHAIGTSTTSDDLADRLRPLYPRVHVVDRSLSGEPHAVYVYRDGAFVPPDTTRWWEAADTAAVTISTTTGMIVDANERVGRVFGARPEDIVGRSLTDFVPPDALETARTVFATILEVGEARSSVRLRRHDGSDALVEFRAALVRDGVRVWYQPVDPQVRERATR